ncbi:MAG: hypothetical protein AcusKO_27600 [Acuticoccus sp.]
MSLSSRIDALPVEEWAATAARTVRRLRRRVMRKPARSMGALFGVVAIAAIASNALWEQTGEHPAPLWAKADEPAAATERLVAAHSPATPAARPDALVAEIQTLLGDAGYYAGPADGILTDTTREAIALFETDNGLDETGEPSVALLSAFGAEDEGGEVVAAVEVASVIATPEPARTPVPPLPALGSIAEIQAALNRAGHGPLSEDGVMGPRTRAALDAFAQNQGLAATGMTPALLRALSEATR